MAQKKTSEHQEIIRKLFDADKTAGERVEKARQEAEKIVEDAGRKADAVIKKARKDAESEAQAIVREAGEESGGTARKSDASDQIKTLRRHARDNMEQATDFLVDWVTMKTSKWN